MCSRQGIVALRDLPDPPFRRIGELRYGEGLCQFEAVSLRVKVMVLEHRQITVCRGERDRPVLLPTRAHDALCARLDDLACRHEADLAVGCGEVDLPHAPLGHQDVRTTMLYTHIVERGPLGVVCPLDRGATRCPR